MRPLTPYSVRNLALEYPKSASNDGSFLIYLTARDPERGEKALEQLRADSKLKRAKALTQDGGPTDIMYHQLDISDSKSITSFCKFLRKEHPDGIDIVINNAGIAMDGLSKNLISYIAQAHTINAFVQTHRLWRIL